MDKSTAYGQVPPTYEQAMGGGDQSGPAYAYPAGLQQQQQPSAPQQHQPQAPYAPYAPPMPMPMPQQQVVIVQQPTLLALGRDASYIHCPYCHVQKLTRVEYVPSTGTHLLAALLCVVGLWCCVCVPYCMESCMYANHYCGNCNHYLGAYRNE